MAHTQLRAIVFGFLVSTCLSNSAAAQTDVYVGKIRQIFVDQNRAVGEVNSAATAKDFVVTFDDKSQCVITTVEKKDSLVSLDISSCARKADLRAGMLFENSLLFGAASTAPDAAPGPSQPATALEAASTDVNDGTDRLRLGFGIAAGLPSTIEFKDGTVTGATGTFDSTFKFKSGIALSVEMRKLKKMGWGFIGSLGFDPNREISSVTLSSGGMSTTIQGGTGGAQLSMTTVEMNAVYRWNEFYLPFGINFAAFRFQKPNGFDDGYEISGGAGAQLGIGLYLNRNLAIEAWSRATTIRFKLTSFGSPTTNFGDGSYASATLGVKALF